MQDQPEQSSEAAPQIPLDKLVRVYRKMRQRISEINKEYESKLLEVQTQQEAVKLAMKDQLLALGVKSIRTADGTISLSKRTVYSTQDWDSFKEFVMENDAIDLLEKRIAQVNMRTFLEENPGVVPAGLNSMTEYTVSVVKPR